MITLNPPGTELAVVDENEILFLDPNTLQWSVLDNAGTEPVARFSHSMAVIPTSNAAVTAAGRALASAPPFGLVI